MKRLINRLLRITSSVVLIVALLCALPDRIRADALSFEFRGTVWDNGNAFEGDAWFKFSIREGETVLWTNDGSAVGRAQPTTAIKVHVVDGQFSAILGAPPMAPIPESALAGSAIATLRVWVDTGGGFELLGDKYPIPGVVAEDTGMSQPGKKIPGVARSPEVVAAKIAKEKSGDGKSARNPEGLAREYVLRRLDSNGRFDIEQMHRAKEEFDAKRAALQSEGPRAPLRDAGIYGWEWLGPGNIGGRVRTILIHPTSPNIMWIGSASGGVWKTTNAGATWNPLDDFLPNLAVTSLVMDPNDSDVIYAATGELVGSGPLGAGIYKTVNGGTSWNFAYLAVGAADRYISRLAHHPINSNTLFMAGDDVRLSNDGGVNFPSVLTPNKPDDYPMDIKISSQLSPLGDHYVLVGTYLGDVYLSANMLATPAARLTTGGPNTLPNDGGRCEVAISGPGGGTPPVMYVSMNRNGGEVWTSTNGGSIWSLAFGANPYLCNPLYPDECQGNYDNAIWVDPTDSGRIIVGGIDLWRDDGNANLTRISNWTGYHRGTSAHADQHVIVAHPDYDGTTNTIVYFGNDGGIQMTYDVLTVSQNSGWVNLANNLGITQFFGGAADLTGSLIVGGSQDNDKLRYQPWDGEQNWYQAESGDGGFCAVNYDNPTIVYGEYTNLQIKKSTNGGQTYANAIVGLDDAGSDTQALFIAPFVMDPINPSILVAGGASIWRTTLAANSWIEIRVPIAGAPLCSAIDIARSNNSVIWVGYDDGTVSRTTDVGSNWTDVDGDCPPDTICLPNRFVTDIAISPHDENDVVVVFGGYQNGNVWMTNDGGDTWDPRGGIPPLQVPAVQINTVRFHPVAADWIYLGTDLGVLASEDAGLTWNITPRTGYDGHQGPANVVVNELFWQGDEYLIAATHGRGMFRCRPLQLVYVDSTHLGPEDGSLLNPYNTIQEAIDAAGNGTAIIVKPGVYDEAPVTFFKRGTISITHGTVIIK